MSLQDWLEDFETEDRSSVLGPVDESYRDQMREVVAQFGELQSLDLSVSQRERLSRALMRCETWLKQSGLGVADYFTALLSVEDCIRVVSGVAPLFELAPYYQTERRLHCLLVRWALQGWPVPTGWRAHQRDTLRITREAYERDYGPIRWERLLGQREAV